MRLGASLAAAQAKGKWLSGGNDRDGNFCAHINELIKTLVCVQGKLTLTRHSQSIR
jgi:hypothetical protein